MLKIGRIFTALTTSNSSKLLLRSLASSESAPMQPTKEDVNDLFRGSAASHDNHDEHDEQMPRRHPWSLNRVELVGGVAVDPVIRLSKSGAEFMTFRIATNNSFRDRDNPRRIVEGPTEFHSITAFTGIDRLKRVLRKGRRVFVTGRIHYTDIETAQHPRATVTADTVIPLDYFRRDSEEVDDDVSQPPPRSA